MPEAINETVSVNFISKPGMAYPWMILWRGRRYTVQKVGLHYLERQGQTLCHLFSVTDGNTFFKLSFATDTLVWKLIEIDSENNC